MCIPKDLVALVRYATHEKERPWGNFSITARKTTLVSQRGNNLQALGTEHGRIEQYETSAWSRLSLVTFLSSTVNGYSRRVLIRLYVHMSFQMCMYISTCVKCCIHLFLP